MRFNTKTSIAFAALLSLSISCPSIQAQQTNNEIKLGNEAKVSSSPANNEKAEKLWAAARSGDVAAIGKLLDEGVDVNAATHYHSTALCFACDRGHVEAVKLLLKRGADPNVQDTFYKASPLDWAMMNGHYEVLSTLIAEGAKGADRLLLDGVGGREKKLVEAVLKSGKASPEKLAEAVRQAELLKLDDFSSMFSDLKFDRLPKYELNAEKQKQLEGKYSSKEFPAVLTVSFEEGILKAEFGGQTQQFVALRENEFASGSATLIFKIENGKVAQITRSQGDNSLTLKPSETSSEGTPPNPANPKPSTANEEDQAEATIAFEPSPQDALVSSKNWPAFRGIGSRGVADGQRPPVQWSSDNSSSVAWKVELPGLGNSCPVIWEDKLFITTAASDSGDKDVKIGLYGDVNSVEDDSQYQFVVICLSKHTGKELWRQIAHTGKPAVKRHSKSSHANPTVATDGKHVLAFFGSEGLYCYDMDGKLIWQRNFGVLDSGWFFNADYQWGFGSSPVIFGDRVFLQCDIQKGSFVAALDLATGQDVWRSEREEIPTWSTPVVHQFGDMPMLITHGTRAARAYDARDGKLLWTLKDHSEIVVPTPFVAHDLIYLTSGYTPIQPVVAIRPTARGEMSLPGQGTKDGESQKNGEAPSSNSGIAWSHNRGGTYMPTPIVYGDFMYTCANNGVITCYKATTGEQVYRKRLPGSGTLAFTGSPIAADGHVYFPAEDGQVYVVQAGPKFKLISANPSGGKVMTTPAISEGLFFLRTTDALIAFKKAEQ